MRETTFITQSSVSPPYPVYGPNGPLPRPVRGSRIWLNVAWIANTLTLVAGMVAAVRGVKALGAALDQMKTIDGESATYDLLYSQYLSAGWVATALFLAGAFVTLIATLTRDNRWGELLALWLFASVGGVPALVFLGGATSSLG